MKKSVLLAERLSVLPKSSFLIRVEKIMVVFAVATSIDALAAGLTFAALDVNIWLAISLIGIITCVCSFFGSIIGAKIGSKFKNKAEIAGGIILLGIGLKILIEHLITLM